MFASRSTTRMERCDGALDRPASGRRVADRVAGGWQVGARRLAGG
jgi:hypothetical protein